jgi:hypothetical protein
MNILRPIQKEFYGDDVRWFLGYVINSAPPAGLEGRVKVRILGVHSGNTDEIPEKDLPWAQVIVPTTEGGTSGIGRIPQLTKGSFVFGVFLDGASSQIPLVLGSLPRIELPTTIQSGRKGDLQDDFKYDQSRIQNVVITPIIDDDKQTADFFELSSTFKGLRRQQSMKFFIDNGYRPIHAAAITGGLEGASGFETTTDKAATGIAQWRIDGTVGSRYSNLLLFASSYQPPVDWKLFSTQLQFVLFELRNRLNLANSKLLATDNIKDASVVFNRYYLKIDQKTDQLAQRAYEEVLS